MEEVAEDGPFCSYTQGFYTAEYGAISDFKWRYPNNALLMCWRIPAADSIGQRLLPLAVLRRVIIGIVANAHRDPTHWQ